MRSGRGPFRYHFAMPKKKSKVLHLAFLRRVERQPLSWQRVLGVEVRVAPATSSSICGAQGQTVWCEMDGRCTLSIKCPCWTRSHLAEIGAGT